MLENKITTTELYSGDVKQIRVSAKGFGSFCQERYCPEKTQKENHELAAKRCLSMYGYLKIISVERIDSLTFSFEVK